MNIEVGDRIKFRAELLAQIQMDEVAGKGDVQIVEVVEIKEGDKPGLKTMVLGRTRP